MTPGAVARLLCPWDFPDKNAGVDCRFLLQGTFPTQGWNPHLLHWQAHSFEESFESCDSITTHLFFPRALFVGEGNGNPLQYSSLENPMDSGAWWVAVYCVAKSQT